jgi:hypothetical protein
MARKPAWLWSRGSALVILGFSLNLAGLLGGSLWLNPAERAVETASSDIALQSARARVIRDATASDELAEHMGSLVYSLPAGAGQTDDVRATMGELLTRALDRRHDAVRSYLAELALAGAVDFNAASNQYEALVSAEKVDFNINTYRAVNAFEANLAMAMVKAEGDSAIRAIALQKAWREAKVEAALRRLTLTLIALAGSTVILFAALGGAIAAPPAPSAATCALAAALGRLQTMEATVDPRQTGVS